MTEDGPGGACVYLVEKTSFLAPHLGPDGGTGFIVRETAGGSQVETATAYQVRRKDTVNQVAGLPKSECP